MQKRNEYKTVTNMEDVNPTISIITSDVNGLNTTNKRERLSQWTEQNNIQHVDIVVIYKQLTLNIKTKIHSK